MLNIDAAREKQALKIRNERVRRRQEREAA